MMYIYILTPMIVATCHRFYNTPFLYRRRHEDKSQIILQELHIGKELTKEHDKDNTGAKILLRQLSSHSPANSTHSIECG